MTEQYMREDRAPSSSRTSTRTLDARTPLIRTLLVRTLDTRTPFLHTPMDPSLNAQTRRTRHIETEVLKKTIRPLGTQNKFRTITMSRRQFRNSHVHHPTLRRAHEKHAKFIGFHWVLSTSRYLRRFPNIEC